MAEEDFNDEFDDGLEIEFNEETDLDYKIE